MRLFRRCIFLFLVGFASSEVIWSSKETALAFFSCAAEGTSESPVFLQEEKDDLKEVSNLMSMALSRRSILSETVIKSVTLAFATALGEIIVVDEVDPSKATARKEALAESLEKCLVDMFGSVDDAFIDEVMEAVVEIESRRSTRVLPGVVAPISFYPNSFGQGIPVFISPALPESSELTTRLTVSLTSTPIFAEVFRTGLSRVDAVNYVTSMTESGLLDLNVYVRNEAASAAANAVALLPENSRSVDYAVAMSRAVSGILQLRGLVSVADANRIARGMIANLRYVVGNRNYTPPGWNSSATGVQPQQASPQLYQGNPVFPPATGLSSEHYQPGRVTPGERTVPVLTQTTRPYPILIQPPGSGTNPQATASVQQIGSQQSSNIPGDLNLQPSHSSDIDVPPQRQPIAVSSETTETKTSVSQGMSGSSFPSQDSAANPQILPMPSTLFDSPRRPSEVQQPDFEPSIVDLNNPTASLTTTTIEEAPQAQPEFPTTNLWLA